MASIADEKYVALTTYKKDGGSSSTPVWIVEVGDGRLGFTTSSSSLKVTRINRDARVAMVPSDARGKVTDGGNMVEGIAEVAHGDEFQRVFDLIKAKYGVQAKAITYFGQFMKRIGRGSGTDCAIIITPTP